jgi:hypothetical protein
MEIYIYCVVDSEGNITSTMAGENIQAPEQYDFTTVVDNWNIVEQLHLYKIENNELVLKG